MSARAAVLLTAALGAEPALTESRAVELALANSPAVKALSSRVDEAQAEVDLSGRWNNPQLRVQNLRSDLLVSPAISGGTYADHPFERMRVGLRWSPPELGLQEERRTAAQLEACEAKAQRSQGERDLAARVRSLHATARSLQGQLDLAQSALAQRDRLRQIVKSRVEQSAAPALELSLAEIDYLDAVTAREELDLKRRLALEDLRALLGLPAEPALELSAEKGRACGPPPDSAALLERAVKNSPHLSLLQSHLSAVDAERRRKWLELVPYPDYLQLTDILASDSAPSYFTLQLGLTLPLFDQKTADRRMLAARRERVQQEHRGEIIELERKVHRAAAEQAEQAAIAARFREATALLDEGLSHARRALEAGQTTNLAQVVQLETRVRRRSSPGRKQRMRCRSSDYRGRSTLSAVAQRQLRSRPRPVWPPSRGLSRGCPSRSALPRGRTERRCESAEAPRRCTGSGGS
jgi:outer membrane protein TolC